MRAPLVLALILAAPGVSASEAPGGFLVPGVSRMEATDEALTLDEAVQQAEKRYKARAVKAEERQENGRRVYHIRLLSEDGRVFDITVDAATGRTE
jgi:uncharacterized membrane protein YkoI